MTIEQYQAQMAQNQEAFAANIARTEPRPEDLAFFRALPEVVNTLVITEDWCGDALAHVPALAKVAALTGKLNLRVFLRDQNLDLADQYLKEGKYRSVPVFVFFDQQMRELGHFIERPARVTAEMAATVARVAAAHPEHPDIGGSLETMSDAAKQLRLQATRDLRRERAATWTDMLLEDIETLLSASGAAR
jgi:hypothetical protein